MINTIDIVWYICYKIDTYFVDRGASRLFVPLPKQLPSNVNVALSKYLLVKRTIYDQSILSFREIIMDE